MQKSLSLRIIIFRKASVYETKLTISALRLYIGYSNASIHETPLREACCATKIIAKPMRTP